MTSLSANVVNLFDRRVFPGSVGIANGRIASIREYAGPCDGYILPGFIDAHVHVESSMMVPSEFARFAVAHGTVATVSDPHEIANVLGVDGVRFMVANGRRVPFKFHFGVPSCVPATCFETAGATLDAAAVEALFRDDGLRSLSEVMNYPGVLAGDADLLAKIASARRRGLPVDGHAPGVRGDAARRYASAGIATDHECVALDEALDKIACGMAILIREGSAAKNFDALHPLLSSHPNSCMFCSDDLHPDSLQHGHIDRLVRRAVACGHDVFDVLRAACVRPVEHYGLPVGQLRVGDPADFIVVDNLTDFRIRQTEIDGQTVAYNGVSRIGRIEYDVECDAPNVFRASRKHMNEFRTPEGSGLVRVIEAYDGQLVTGESHRLPAVTDEVQKIAVVNRYADAPPAVGFVHGFGLRRGVLAASVAHDSHNIVAVGVDDGDLCAAVNAVIDARGGLAVVDGAGLDVLPLEVAGLMSRDGDGVAAGYAKLDALARGLGSPLAAPFMTLSFMALLVIPALKLSDKGLFDGRTFRFVPLFVDARLRFATLRRSVRALGRFCEASRTGIIWALLVVGCARPVPVLAPPAQAAPALRPGVDWPRFLGPSGDGTTTETNLARTLPPGGPPVVWSTDLGGGFAAPVIANGKLYHFDRHGNANRLTCRDEATGTEVWKYEYATDYVDKYGYDGGPRCCPVVDGERVYVYGAEGDLHCVTTSGTSVWKVETRTAYNVVQNFFGVGSTPVVEGDVLIVAVGGSPPGPEPDDFRELKSNGTAVVAFDKATGKERYRVGDDLASYASPVVATAGGKRRGFHFGRNGLLGFDPATGTQDFHFPWRAKLLESVNVANPVVVGDTVLVTESYQDGAALVRPKLGGVETVWKDERGARDKRLACHWNTPVHASGYVYGCNGRHTNEATLVCVELATGRVAWRQAIDSRSSLTLADGRFWMLGEYGTLTLVKPNPERYDEIARCDLGREGARLLKYPCWASPVIARGRLYLRGERKLVCFDIAA